MNDEWHPAYKAKLENIVDNDKRIVDPFLVVKAIDLANACKFVYELTSLQEIYVYKRTIEKAGEKSFGLYLFRGVER